MNADEVALLVESLAKAIDSAADGESRSAVTEFGWHELLAEEPDTAVRVLATLQGSRRTPFSFLDDVMLASAEAELADATGVLLPNAVGGPIGELSQDGVRARGVARAEAARVIAPVLDTEGRLVLAVVDLPEASPADVMDPASGWRSVSVERRLSEATVLTGDAAEPTWRRMRAAGRRALAHELVAVGGAMLEMTVDHVSTREQFGRPLATLQVVKHKLADVRLWQEVATVAADAAWEDRTEQSAALAKTLAGRFTRTARENCQQLLGGMGFTWEHAFHGYLRRALVLEPLLGSPTTMRAELGAALRAGAMPVLAPL